MYQPVYSRDIKKIYNALKSSAKRRGISFSLTLSDLNDLTFPISCPVFGMPLRYNVGGVSDDSVSIDRIDSSRGYEAGNIIVISWRANKLKNNASQEELIRIAEFYRRLSD